MALPRPTSDHLPIFLHGGEISTSPKPFRFQLMWLKHLVLWIPLKIGGTLVRFLAILGKSLGYS